MRLSVPGVGQPSETLRFRYEGEVVEGRSGDTVAASLIDAGHLSCRKAGDGTERGLFCGMGVCNECAIVVDGATGVLACMTPTEDGMFVEKQPLRPMAPVRADHQQQGRELSPSVLVVGGGPAGLSAAATIAEAGVDVVLIDKRSTLGGQFYKQPGPAREVVVSLLDAQYRAGRALIERVVAAGVEVIAGVSVWGAFSPDLLTADGNGTSWTFRPRRLVLATGAQERPVPIPGWTLPGVLMTGAAQTLLRSSQVSPGRKVLLSGSGPLNMQVAAELVRTGAEVAGLVEQADLRWWKGLLPGVGMALSAPGLVKRGMSYRWTLAKADVPLFDRSSVIAIHGDENVEAATVASIDASGEKMPGTETEFEVDAVCLGYGFVPSSEIARALGCAHKVDRQTKALITIQSKTGRTSLETVWVVGDGAKIGGAYVAQALGDIAAHEILNDLAASPTGALQPSLRRSQRLLRRHRRFQKSMTALYSARTLTTELAESDTIVCRCESISLGRLTQSFSGGAASAASSKRLTRAGMGKCQGRYCSASILALAAEASGEEPEEFSGFAPQAPLRPTEIGRIANPSADAGTTLRT